MKKLLIIPAAAILLNACSFFLENDSDLTNSSQNSQWSPRNGVLTMAVMGDSLSAGLLANTHIDQPFASERIAAFMATVATLSSNSERGQLGNAKEIDRLFAKKEYTALAGTQPYSLSNQLKKRFNTTNEIVLNYSVSSTRTSNFQMQIDAMKSDYETGSTQPADIVVMHVGSNDWCDMRPVGEFETDLTAGIKEVMQLNSDARILVLPISDLVSVLSVTDKKSNSSTLFGAQPLTCTEIRKTTKTCMKRKIQMGASTYDVSEHRKSLFEFNQTIEKVVTNLVTDMPSFTGKIAVGSAYSQITNFDWSWLAIDCFHPGKNGQAIIGELAWKDLSALLDNVD